MRGVTEFGLPARHEAVPSTARTCGEGVEMYVLEEEEAGGGGKTLQGSGRREMGRESSAGVDCGRAGRVAGGGCGSRERARGRAWGGHPAGPRSDEAAVAAARRGLLGRLPAVTVGSVCQTHRAVFSARRPPRPPPRARRFVARRPAGRAGPVGGRGGRARRRGATVSLAARGSRRQPRSSEPPRPAGWLRPSRNAPGGWRHPPLIVFLLHPLCTVFCCTPAHLLVCGWGDRRRGEAAAWEGATWRGGPAGRAVRGGADGARPWRAAA